MLNRSNCLNDLNILFILSEFVANIAGVARTYLLPGDGE